MDNDRLELLGQVAVWYYEDNMDQSEIAERIGRSRSMVSRMLQEARELGLVEIRVTFPLKTDTELETRLCRVFSLAQASVLASTPTDDYETLLRRLGRLGARCLQERLRDGIQIGIGGGTTVHQVVRALPKTPLAQARVVQISGAVGSGDPVFDGPELTRWLAEKLSASYHPLHAPLIVKDENLAESLHQERTIAETLAWASQVDIALVGIGTLDPALSSLQRAGYLYQEDLAALQQVGAVGDISSRHLDINGNPVDLPLNRRVIGQDLETLRSIPIVIAVAGNVRKAPAILAALRGRFINVLVTDGVTAAEVLSLHETQPVTVSA